MRTKNYSILLINCHACVSYSNDHQSIHFIVKVNIFPGEMMGESTNINHSNDSEFSRLKKSLKIIVFVTGQ